MFKTRKFDVDSIRGSSRPQTINLRSASQAKSGKVAVRSGDAQIHTSRNLRHVPDEYRTFDRARRGGWGFILFLAVLFVASAAGYYYWTTKTPGFQGDSVALTVTANKEIVSGQAMTYLLEYQNNDLVTLKTVNVDVQWPVGFYFDTASEKPTSDAATTWNLGPLDPGQKKVLEIKGQLVGLKGDTEKTVFRLSYRPENINSDFEISQTVETFIADAQIDMQLTTSSKVIAGSATDFSLKLTNVTSEVLKDVDIEIGLPKDFDLASSSPKLTDGHLKTDLAVGKPLEVHLLARTASDAVGSQAWTVDVSQIVNGQQRKLLHNETQVSVVNPDFGIDLKMNGGGDNAQADFNQTLNYQLKLKNQGTSAVEGLRVTALIDSTVLDRSSMQTNGTVQGTSIVWTKEQVSDLASMDPQKEVILSWKVNTLQRSVNEGRSTVDTVITLDIEGLTGWQKNSSVFVVTVGQGLVFNQGLYWDLAGQTVGSGQLPPVTNEKTQYLAIWSLDSGSQDYDSVNVSTFLPPKVTFVNSEDVDEGTVKYDEATRRLEWQINNFSSKLLPLKASFYLKLVPTDEDKGTVMTILNPATLVASGQQTFQSKSFSLTTQQVITTQGGDVGTVIE